MARGSQMAGMGSSLVKGYGLSDYSGTIVPDINGCTA